MKEAKVQIPKVFKVLFERFKYRYKIFYGGRGSAKSHSFARALLLIGRQRKIRVLCAREIQNSIKDSVHKLLKEVIEKYEFTEYDVKNDSIVNRITGTEFIFRGLFRNFNEIKSLEGIDYCWVEEAQAVSNDSLKVLIPTIRKEGSEIWFSYNRFLEHDPVHDRFARNPDEKTYAKKVSYRDNPYFTQTLRDEMERDKKRNPDEYLHIWEGEPLYQSEDSLLSRSLVQAAADRLIDPVGGIEIGVDVARFGSDKTIFVKRKGLAVTDYQVYEKLGVNQVVEKLKMFSEKDALIKVDATGIGGGVADYMRDDGYSCIDINFGSSPKDKDKYDMLISEAWFEFKDMIDTVSIPFHTELFDELTNRRWRMNKKSQRCIESKADYKKRQKKSPDFADACLLCFYNPDCYGLFPDKQKQLTKKNDVNRIKRIEKRIKITSY
jgi:phage terminase large subunit